ncbi:MAG: amidohydrolase [Flavobacteriales bacterium]|jgi:amidohydrolase
MMFKLQERIKELAAQHLPKAIAIRRKIHENPELSFKETETCQFICDELNSIGLNGFKKIGGTGIVLDIKGKNPESRYFALRADIDALPIVEGTGVEYASKNEGKMHACGHDVHTTCLLGAAKILFDTRENWQGTIRCIFQPGEELLPGGASILIEAGVLEAPQPLSIIGQHVFPDLKAGEVGFRAGEYMASADEIYMTVHGIGGHGAMPHKNIDPILIASHIIIALQQISSRNANPETPTVLSIGKIQGLGATNVIPSTVTLEGTFRTFDETWRSLAHKLIQKTAQDIAKSMGGSCEVEIRKGYPVLKNDEDLTEKVKKLAMSYLGADKVVDLSRRMTAEDFAYYTHKIPGSFYRLGTASQDGQNTFPVHHPKFNIDESALETGMGLMAWLAIGDQF